MLVEQALGIVGEEVALTSGELEAESEVVRGVVGGERGDDESARDAGVEGAMSSKGESVDEIGESDEEEREKRSAIPLVIQQDVQVVEGVGVEQVRLVEKEDGMDALLPELLDVGADGVEDCRRGRRRGEAECDAELPVEVALSERRVVVVGQSVARSLEPLAKCAQHARLAGARLADEQTVFALSLIHI